MGPWQRLGGQQVRVQVEPTGRERAGRPRKYSPLARKGIGKNTVVWGKGGGGGQAPRSPRGVKSAEYTSSVGPASMAKTH